MQVSITGRHLDLTEPLKDYVNDKLQHLKHSFDQVVDVHVVLDVEKFRQICEITIHANGLTIHGKDETEDMYASIDGVVDKINRQLKRYRAKLHRHQTEHAQRKGREIKVAHRVLDTAEAIEEFPADHQPEVLELEQMEAKPMSIDEAVMQLELASRKPVLVFTNQDTNHMNVLYRRDDGKLGWIDPEQT
ncbi:MAG TPA: ribosome-associated translation inhibitor RaiA [Mariprofundaceae bacterium]|nr:ribosome-associated translation inhibitor RaiA [Mariprofundaceae bacterium]